MLEILRESISLVNLPLTVLLAFLVVYWLAVIIGALDLDWLDFDFDAEADDAGIFHSLGRWFHLDEGPFIAVFSVLILSLWAISMIANHFLNPGGSWLWGALLFIPNFVVSVFITKLVTYPVYRLYRSLNRSETDAGVTVVGQPCVVTTTQVNHTQGQAEIRTRGAPILINARTASERESLKKGEPGVVVRQEKEKGIYIITKLEE